MATLLDERARFHYRVANLFLRFRRYEAAANAFGRCLRIRPGDPHVQFQRAWSLLQVPKRRGEAIIGFQSLLTTSPSALGYYLLACGLQKESRHDEAIAAFQAALGTKGSRSVDLYHNYAVSLTALGRLEEAVDAYESAAHLNPSDAKGWVNLGWVFAELGRWKDAAPCQERAMRLSPSLTNGLNLASTLHQMNRLDEAELVLRDALVRDPGSPDAKALLALVLTGQDRYDEATRLARKSTSSTRMLCRHTSCWPVDRRRPGPWTKHSRKPDSRQRLHPMTRVL